MVRNQLQQLLVLFILVLVNNTCLASPRTMEPKLILFTDVTKSTLGRPIRVELYGISLKTKITNIKLTHLNKNFGVVVDYTINDISDKRWPNQSVQILKLKLYPRQTGSILIPRIRYNNIHSDEKMIRITKGKTGEPKIRLSANSPYERQQIIALVTITSNNSTARLSIKKNFEINDFESAVLPFKRLKNKNGTYQLQIGWALTALKSGRLKLELPAIEYSISGVSRKQFYLPAKIIYIKTLPLYLPPTIPVGKITIQSQLSRDGLLRSDSLIYWDIKLNGNLNNAYSLPPILRQIKSTGHIKFSPITSERSLQATENRLISTVVHSIPFKALESGFLKLPEIKLQYFDPDDGKIKILFHQSKKIFVLTLFWRSLITVLIILFLAYALNTSYKTWQRFKFSKFKRQQAIQILQEDQNNLKKVRESIRLLSEAEYWPKNSSMSQWGKCWANKYQVNNDFESLINMLSAYFYNKKTNCDENELNFRLLELIQNRKKL